MIKALPKSSGQIWALVSGFPAPARERRLIAMFQAYIDESGNGDDELFVMGGYIAPAENWARFSDEWQEILEMRSSHFPTLEYFKMSEMKTTPDRLEMTSWFYGLIEKYATTAISCAVPVQGLRRAIDRIDWPDYVTDVERLKNPYLFGFKSIITGLAQHPRFEFSSPVDFIFDDTNDKSRVVGGWDLMKGTQPDHSRHLIGDTPAFKDDKKVLPLQAADLYAHWAFEWHKTGGRELFQEQNFPWKTSKKVPFDHFVLSGETIQSDLERNLALFDEVIQALLAERRK